MESFGNKLDAELEKRFNFGIVAAGKLYRSSQPDLEFLSYLKKQYGIKTIILLRTGLHLKEKEFCENNNILLVHLPIKSWRRWPEPEKMRIFFELLENSENSPILIHCWKGKDRTGAIIALYRLGCENWTLKETINEMKQRRANWFWQLFIQINAGRIIAS